MLSSRRGVPAQTVICMLLVGLARHLSCSITGQNTGRIGGTSYFPRRGPFLAHSSSWKYPAGVRGAALRAQGWARRGTELGARRLAKMDPGSGIVAGERQYLRL